MPWIVASRYPMDKKWNGPVLVRVEGLLLCSNNNLIPPKRATRAAAGWGCERGGGDQENGLTKW